MEALNSKRSCFAALLAAVGVVVSSPNASGQVMEDASSSDASSPDAASSDATLPGDDSSSDDGAPVEAGPPSCDASLVVSDAGFDVTAFMRSDAFPADPGAVILDDGSLPAYCAGDVFQLLGVPNPNVPGYDYSQLKAPYATAADCAMYDSQGHAAAHTCLCNQCFVLQQQCDALPGCRAIQKCGWDVGCTDANSCYYPNPKCPGTSVGLGDIIDAQGTGRVATALSSDLLACGLKNNCPKQ